MGTENKNFLRVVLDTNVYISAFNFPEKPFFQIWQQAISGNYRLLISPDIIRETAGVLRVAFKWEEKEIVRYLKLLAKVGKIIISDITIDVIEEHPADNMILECAVSGKANLIVSGNRHLKKLKNYQEIAIVRPTDFMRILGMKK